MDIEQALIEGEHELIFKQILDSSESDQQKIRQLYKNLQFLIERIMTEKNYVRNKKRLSIINSLKFRFEIKSITLNKHFLNLNMN